MKTVSLKDAQRQLSRLVEEVAAGPVLLTHRGRPCAALVALDPKFDRELYALSNNPRLRALIDDACRQAKAGGGIPFSQVQAEVAEREKRQKKRQSRR